MGRMGLQGRDGVKGEKGEPGASSYTPPQMSAFSARKHGQQVTSGTATVKFDQEDIDIGDDFNHKTGVFKCRIQGLYYFSFTFLPYHPYDFEVYLLQNEKIKAKIFYTAGTSRYIMQSQSIILNLQRGDEVKLVMEVPSYINSSDSITNLFNGYLIHAM